MYKAGIQGKTIKVSCNENKFSVDDKSFPADILEYEKGKYHLLIENRSYNAEIISLDKEMKICEVKIGTSVIRVTLRDKYDDLLNEIGIDESSARKFNDIKAPMPGMVLQVMVENGQKIKKGDAIVILEAMKMENILKSPTDGTIKKINVNIGDKVEKNQVMVNLD